MKKTSIFVGIIGAACLIAGSASAQKAGSFAGQTADGNTISLTVTQSGSTFTVAGMSIGMSAFCKTQGNTVDEGWGFFSGADISSGATNFTSANDYYYYTGSMHFAGKSTINGTVTSYTATFVPGNTPPKKAEFCSSPKQTFTLTLQAPDKKLPLPATIDTGRLKPTR